jgi:hypothetical protein
MFEYIVYILTSVSRRTVAGSSCMLAYTLCNMISNMVQFFSSLQKCCFFFLYVKPFSEFQTKIFGLYKSRNVRIVDLERRVCWFF